MDLHLDIADPGGGVRDRIEVALRDALRGGRLEAGARLPATRALAADLGVARGTVVEVYEQLTAEGWLTARHGSGTYVSDAATPARTQLSDRGDGSRRQPRVLPFRPGSPDLSAFPRRLWAQAIAETCRSVGHGELGYGDPRGPRAVRDVLAGYLARVRGVVADPDAILLTTGLAQGLSLTAAVLADRGVTSIGVEDPGSDGFPRLLRHAALDVRGIPVDEHGLDVDALATADVSAVVTTPAHQFPIGGVLPPRRRRVLAHWAQTGGLVIEDDYDAEFRYDRRPVGALQPLAPHHVIYAGSASKALAPGLRLGWLVAPNHLRDDLIAAKANTDLSSPTVDAHALAHLLTTGAHDRYLRKLRRRYHARRDEVLAVLDRHPWTRPRGIAAGLHLVAEITDGPPAELVAARASELGLGIRPVSDYTIEHPTIEGIVIGYGSLTPADQHAALTTLDEVLTTAFTTP